MSMFSLPDLALKKIYEDLDADKRVWTDDVPGYSIMSFALTCKPALNFLQKHRLSTIRASSIEKVQLQSGALSAICHASPMMNLREAVKNSSGVDSAMKSADHVQSLVVTRGPFPREKGRYHPR